MYVRHGGFCSGLECFDANFFGLSGAEARGMDPQQRMVLELVHIRFHGAGHATRELIGAKGAACVGQCGHGFECMISVGGRALEVGYAGLGLTASITSGRVPYLLGLKGPSVTIDTACSSSLVAADGCIA